MNVSGLLGLVALAGLLMFIAGIAIVIMNAAQNRRAGGGIGLAILGLVIGVLFFSASSGLVVVGSSEVAVVFQSVGGDPKLNSLWPTPLGPGVHIITPIINEPIIYSTEIQTYTMARAVREGQIAGDDAVQARSSDGQQVFVDVSVLYGVDPIKANLVHIRYKRRFTDDFVRPTVRSFVREIIAKYSINDIYSGNSDNPSQLAQIEQEIQTGLSEKFSESGLILQDFLLRDTTFSEEFINAVEAKQVAEQQAEQAKQEAERSRTIAKGAADAAVTEAKGEADATIERARGDAEYIRVRAEADAKALALIGEQLAKIQP